MRYDAENDWPILRFADVLLMLGEIENEFNGPTQNALDYINATRLRAGLKKGRRGAAHYNQVGIPDSDG